MQQEADLDVTRVSCCLTLQVLHRYEDGSALPQSYVCHVVISFPAKKQISYRGLVPEQTEVSE